MAPSLARSLHCKIRLRQAIGGRRSSRWRIRPDRLVGRRMTFRHHRERSARPCPVALRTLQRVRTKCSGPPVGSTRTHSSFSITSTALLRYSPRRDELVQTYQEMLSRPTRSSSTAQPCHGAERRRRRMDQETVPILRLPTQHDACANRSSSHAENRFGAALPSSTSSLSSSCSGNWRQRSARSRTSRLAIMPSGYVLTKLDRLERSR